jgi:hypothetical protein
MLVCAQGGVNALHRGTAYTLIRFGPLTQGLPRS